jgi:hypothetical protein
MPSLNRVFVSLASLAAQLVALAAFAGPGAHGPNGEHLDGPPAAAPVGALPRVEAKSEDFELVATLSASELSIYVDRYVSNEPVLKAAIEVESAGLKAVAKFHADHGDYSLTDAAMLKLLATPGQHALVFTVTADDEADLLEGTLATPIPAEAAGFTPSAALIATVAALVTLAAVLFFAWRRRRAAPLLSAGGAR